MNRILCPFDGFKICIYEDKDYIDFLMQDPVKFNLLEKKHVDGEIIGYPITGDIEGIRIKIHYTRKGLTVTISGSFHKYNNSCRTNSNQFFWDDFINVHEKLSSLLSIPNNAYLVNLEAGININIPAHWGLTTTEILKSIFYIQKITTKGTKSVKYLPYKGLSIHHKTEDFEYKIYDKGKQYRSTYEILRFEKKYIKSRAIKKLGYIYYRDLLDQDKIINPIKNITKGFKNLIFYNEKIETSLTLTEKEKDFLLQIKKVNYFESFTGTKKEFNSVKQKYLSLSKRHHPFDIHQELMSIINKMFTEHF